MFTCARGGAFHHHLSSSSSTSYFSLCSPFSSSSSSKLRFSPSFFTNLHLFLTHNKPYLLPKPSPTPLRIMAVCPNGAPPGYRANVGVCLVNSHNQVFVASRLDLPDSWQMPQGGVDENEEPRTAAMRELREETGVTSADIIGEVKEWLTYDFPPDVKAKVTQLWGKEWKGQAQKWFLFRFTGDEKEINLAGDGIERAEFSEWKWLPAGEVIKAAVDFKRPVYEHAFKIFTPILESGDGLLEA